MYWNELKERARKCTKEEALQEIFNRYRGSENNDFIPREKLQQAFEDCGQMLDEGGVTHQLLINAAKRDAVGLSYDEFTRAVLTPSKLEEWATTLYLPRILALCFPVSNLNDDFLGAVSQLKTETIDEMIKVFADKVKSTLIESIGVLLLAIKKMEEEPTPKSSQDNSKFICLGAKVDDFRKSLIDRMGWPNPKFLDSMRNEHEQSEPFTPEISRVEIVPSDEYEYVLRTKPLQLSDESKRRIPDINELLCKNNGPNTAQLRKEEVIALVLYTGPMYYVYNKELRREGESERCYKTTIFVLASALVKLTQVQRIPNRMRLYRGLGAGMDYPNFFYEVDDNGCKGITELGFMSSTKKRDIAIKYSAARGRNRIPVIIEIEGGSIDRGAYIREFSQYEHEEEFLWSPGTFLEPCSTYLAVRESSVFKVVHVRARCNLKTMTIEEYLSVKKDRHLSTFDFLLRELKQNLDGMSEDVQERLNSDPTLNFDKNGNYNESGPICDAASFIKCVLDQCEDIRRKHSEIEADNYADIAKFKEYVCTMLETVSMGESKILGYKEDRTRRICFYLDSPLRTCHRERVSSLHSTLPEEGTERVLKAEELCRITGLLADSVRDRNDLVEPMLVAAAAEGRPARDLLLLLAAGADKDVLDSVGSTSIHAAAKYGHADCIAVLREAGADVNIRNADGQTAAWTAAQNGQAECLRLLIGSRADVDAAEKDLVSPAQVAAQRGHLEILRILAEAGADMSAGDNEDCTPALVAAYAGEEGCVEFLISFGANIGVATIEGVTPVMMAAQQGHDACLALLIGAEADVHAADHAGQTALIFAAEGGRAGCMRLLREAGADIAARDRKGATAAQVTDMYKGWLAKYPIISIEDGLAEDDWDGWRAQTAALG